jgi:hypothetical protein
VSHMNVRYAQSGSTRAMGNIVLGAGLLTSLLTLSAGSPKVGFYVLAALLVLTGLGMRVEAAILALGDQREEG